MTDHEPIRVDPARETGARPPQPGNGYQLPPAAYFDPGWLEQELLLLFPANWNFACTTDDLPRPGTYVCILVGHYPVVVLRDDEGVLRAFHNICRHRGARLLDGSGTCERIVCPYHRWQYDLAGRLSNVPQAGAQLPGLETSEWGLHAVPTGEWMGMVFVNPDARAEPFVSWLDRMPEHLDVFRPQDLTEIARVEYTFQANWKFYIENHIDWYHLWYTHALTLSSLDHHRGDRRQLGRHWMSYEPFKDVPRESPFRTIAWLPDEARQTGAHLLFPNLTLFSGDSWFGTGHITPEGPDAARMSFRLRALPGQDPTAFLGDFEHITQVEDAEMAARLQATVRSPAFSVGPLTSEFEAPITRFHDNYRRYVRW